MSQISGRCDPLFVYATRSVVPSRFANSVQSANMASAFSRLIPSYQTVFRSRPAYAKNPATAFTSYGLALPRGAHPIISHECLDWSYFYLEAFHTYFASLPTNSLIYTRSGSLAAIADSLNISTVVEFHDPITPLYAYWIRYMRRRKRLPKAVAITERMRDDLIRVGGFSSHEVLIAGGGARPDSFTPEPLALAKSYNYNVGYAGSAYRGKGLDTVLACAARQPDIGFHIIGPDLADCLRHGPLGPNVCVYGRRDHTDTIRLLKSMDCLLLPNQRSVIIRSGADIGSHTSPLKMFEYMGTGRPIVASDLSVISCTLHHEKNALLCKADDIDAFCTQLQRLRADPILARNLGEQAQTDFLNHYTWESRARKIHDFIMS
jgi:glycosyltransferase involved in cell wall biosynthesis